MNESPGLSLLDLGPQTESVPVGSMKVRVTGVSVKGVFAIFGRFPEIGSWFKAGKVDLAGLIEQAPDALAAFIAAGCGEPDNPVAESVAASLPVETQLDIIDAIARLTFKNGFGPFVNRILALSDQAQSVNYGRVSGMNSQQASKTL
jgi:hypothetical protein